MNKIKWIIFAAAVVAIFGVIIWAGKGNDQEYQGDATKIISDGPIADHVYGTTDQKVTLIEYGDFQCPGCGKMFPAVKEITEKHKDKLTFIFRNMPLTNIHPNAMAAATAAEAAGLQGKYFEMYELLFLSQSSWSDISANERGGIFENYAQQIGLDITKYKQDIKSADITTKINRDISTGKNKFQVNSTPTFILNGQKIDSEKAVDSEALTKLIDEAVAKAYPNQTSE